MKTAFFLLLSLCVCLGSEVTVENRKVVLIEKVTCLSPYVLNYSLYRGKINDSEVCVVAGDLQSNLPGKHEFVVKVTVYYSRGEIKMVGEPKTFMVGAHASISAPLTLSLGEKAKWSLILKDANGNLARYDNPRSSRAVADIVKPKVAN